MHGGVLQICLAGGGSTWANAGGHAADHAHAPALAAVHHSAPALRVLPCRPAPRSSRSAAVSATAVLLHSLCACRSVLYHVCTAVA